MILNALFLIDDADTSTRKPKKVCSHSKAQTSTTRSQCSEFYNVQKVQKKNLKEVNTIINTSHIKINDNDIDALLADYKRVARNVSNYINNS